MSTNPDPIAITFTGEGIPLEFQDWPPSEGPPFVAKETQLPLSFKNPNAKTVKVTVGDFVVDSGEGHAAYVKKAELLAVAEIAAGQIGSVTMDFDFDPIPSGVTIGGLLKFTTDLV